MWLSLQLKKKQKLALILARLVSNWDNWSEWLINNWINGIVFILAPEEEEKISLVSNATDEIVDLPIISPFLICLWKLK